MRRGRREEMVEKGARKGVRDKMGEKRERTKTGERERERERRQRQRNREARETEE